MADGDDVGINGGAGLGDEAAKMGAEAALEKQKKEQERLEAATPEAMQAKAQEKLRETLIDKAVEKEVAKVEARQAAIEKGPQTEAGKLLAGMIDPKDPNRVLTPDKLIQGIKNIDPAATQDQDGRKLTGSEQQAATKLAEAKGKKQLFDAMDTDHNGILTKKEKEAALNDAMVEFKDKEGHNPAAKNEAIFGNITKVSSGEVDRAQQKMEEVRALARAAAPKVNKVEVASTAHVGHHHLGNMSPGSPTNDAPKLERPMLAGDASEKDSNLGKADPTRPPPAPERGGWGRV